MANAGSVEVVLTARTEEFTRQLRHAQHSFEEFHHSLHGISSTLGNVFAGFGIAAAASEMGELVKKGTELALAFEEGQLNYAQFMEEVVSSIPLLGKIRELGVGIRDAMEFHGGSVENSFLILAKKAREAMGLGGAKTFFGMPLAMPHEGHGTEPIEHLAKVDEQFSEVAEQARLAGKEVDYLMKRLAAPTEERALTKSEIKAERLREELIKVRDELSKFIGLGDEATKAGVASTAKRVSAMMEQADAAVAIAKARAEEEVRLKAIHKLDEQRADTLKKMQDEADDFAKQWREIQEDIERSRKQAREGVGRAVAARIHADAREPAHFADSVLFGSGAALRSIAPKELKNSLDPKAALKAIMDELRKTRAVIEDVKRELSDDDIQFLLN